MSRHFLIDTDAGSDDVVALIMALRQPDVSVLGMTVVAGNVGVSQGVRNTLYTVELCRAEAPVWEGAKRPLMRPPMDATFFHGLDGLGDQGYPPPRSSPTGGHAADAIIRLSRQRPELTLVTLGPLTNVAMALLRDPGVAERVGRCVVMGGAACTVGNVTPAAEYNMWADPEAARIVFESGMPLEMVGWELCRGEANLDEEDMRRLRELDTPLAHFALDCNETAIRANRQQSGDPGLALPDPVAMAVALEPGVCTRRSRHFVQIETRSELTRGMTVVDALNVVPDERNRGPYEALIPAGANAEVCWEIDVPRFKRILVEALSAGVGR